MKKIIFILVIFLTVSATSQVVHTVKKAETLFGISKQYGVTIDDLRSRNLVLKNGLQVGQTITIPTRKPVVILDSIGAKIIAIELTDCEYVKKELNLVNKVLNKVEDNSKTKDDLISVMGDERKTVNKLAETNQELLVNSEKQKEDLRKDLNRQKNKNAFNKVLYFVIGVATTATTYSIIK